MRRHRKTENRLHLSLVHYNTHQVKTLKPLSALKLQQLCALMEEVTFEDEEYITREGEAGEKFFLTIIGTVSGGSRTVIQKCQFEPK